MRSKNLVLTASLYLLMHCMQLVPEEFRNGLFYDIPLRDLRLDAFPLVYRSNS